MITPTIIVSILMLFLLFIIVGLWPVHGVVFLSGVASEE